MAIGTYASGLLAHSRIEYDPLHDQMRWYDEPVPPGIVAGARRIAESDGSRADIESYVATEMAKRQLQSANDRSLASAASRLGESPTPKPKPHHPKELLCLL